jgi:Ca2+-binding RTX toxin-like protein
MVAALGAVAGSSLLPAAAFAAGPGHVEAAGDTVYFTAGGNATNDVVVTRSGRTVTIVDRVSMGTGRGCARVGGSGFKVRCTLAKDPNWVEVDLGNLNDKFTNKTGVSADVSGGLGNDTLTGGSGRDWLWGDDGNDAVSGGGGTDELGGGDGNDTLRGGAGDDNLETDPGADTILGGSGFDTVYYSTRMKPVTVDLDGAKGDDGEKGERDTVGADVEGIVGGLAADHLTGNGIANLIQGGDGNDVIRGGGGNDVLVGQAGNDSLYGDGGNDYLVGEYRHRAGESASLDNASAKDRLDGGSNGPIGDVCAGVRAATLVNCEYTR